METYDQYRIQRLEYRDSLLVFYTVRTWDDSNWHTFEDISILAKGTNDQIEYFNGGVFYSPDRLKMIAWIGKKMPNAETWADYNKEDPSANRICPQGKDTFYTLGAIVGVRDDTSGLWEFYPLNNRLATCFDLKEEVINSLGQYYFEKMKAHQKFYMVQSGNQKGTLVLRAYGYNLQDSGFWENCWLWEKDTVGSDGLYPFQVWSYRHPNAPTCIKCAEPLKRPGIIYPEAILELYRKGNKE